MIVPVVLSSCRIDCMHSYSPATGLKRSSFLRISILSFTKFPLDIVSVSALSDQLEYVSPPSSSLLVLVSAFNFKPRCHISCTVTTSGSSQSLSQSRFTPLLVLVDVFKPRCNLSCTVTTAGSSQSLSRSRFTPFLFLASTC